MTGNAYTADSLSPLRTHLHPLVSRESMPMHPDDRAGLREWVTAKMHREQDLQKTVNR
jgi:hypothetical protein